MPAPRQLGLFTLLLLAVSVPVPSWAAPRYFEAAGSRFIVRTDTSAAKAQRLVQDLESRASALAEVLGRSTPWTLPVEVFILDSGERFAEVLPRVPLNQQRDAHLVAGADRVFIVARDKDPADLLDAVGHELGHVLVEREILWRPFWFVEGAAEYFRRYGRPADNRKVDDKDAYAVDDLLSIVRSAAWDDKAREHPFRTQAYRLLRLILKSDSEALSRFTAALRQADGRDARPAIADRAVLEAGFRTYAEEPVRLASAATTVPAREIAEAEWNRHQGFLYIAVGRAADASTFFDGDSAEHRQAQAVWSRFARPGEEARRVLDRAAREFPESALVNLHFASIESQNPQTVRAQIEAAERVVRLWPDFGRGHAAMARLQLAAGNLDRALAAVERSIELEPDRADRAYELRTDILMGMRRHDDAIVSIRIADELPHNDAATAEYFGRRISLVMDRVQNQRRAADRARLDARTDEVRAIVAEREPPKPIMPPQRLPDWQMSWEIEAPGPVEVLESPLPDYPDALRQESRSGDVLLSVTIDASGKVTAVGVSKSALPEMNDSLVATVRQWTFRAAAMRRPTMTLKLTLRFVLQ